MTCGLHGTAFRVSAHRVRCRPGTGLPFPASETLKDTIPKLFQTHRLRIAVSAESRRSSVRFPASAVHFARKKNPCRAEPTGGVAYAKLRSAAQTPRAYRSALRLRTAVHGSA